MFDLSEFDDFLRSNVGQFIEKTKWKTLPFKIQYENVPDKWKPFFYKNQFGDNEIYLLVNRKQITNYSDNKELMIAQSKGNKFGI